MKTILGIDLGTSSIKLILVNDLGTVLATATKEYPLYTPNPGWAEQNPAEWISALRDGMRNLLASYPEGVEKIQGIGVTGQMHGIVPIDEKGQPLSAAMIWADRRCDEEVRELEEKLPVSTWMGITGSRPNVSFSLPKILWFRRHMPDLYEKTVCFLLPKDYIRFVLTGSFATDESDASATLMFDIKQKKWSEEILGELGVSSSHLPPVYPSAHLTEALNSDGSNILGIPAGIPVVCGLGDAQAQAIGNGIASPGSWLCTVGTGGQIFTPVEEPVMDMEGQIHTLCHGEKGTWNLMGATLSAGASLQWLAAKVLNMDGEQKYNQLMELVPESCIGSNGLIFLPYLFGERTPHMDDKVKGAFVGLSYSHNRADMVRAVLEGVLFSLRESIEIIHGLQIKYPKEICITGGAAESAVWRQLAADIFGVPISRCSSRSGSAYGAVILAAVGIGWYSSVKEAVDAWIDTTDHVTPSLVNHEKYNAYYSIYKKLYSSLSEANAELDKLVE